MGVGGRVAAIPAARQAPHVPANMEQVSKQAISRQLRCDTHEHCVDWRKVSSSTLRTARAQQEVLHKHAWCAQRIDW
jgi:hypothetical protein